MDTNNFIFVSQNYQPHIINTYTTLKYVLI